MYKGNRLVIIEKQLRRGIIHDLYQGMGDNAKVVGLLSHLGRASTYQKITSRFNCYTIVGDVAEYSKSCTNLLVKKTRLNFSRLKLLVGQKN